MKMVRDNLLVFQDRTFFFFQDKTKADLKNKKPPSASQKRKDEGKDKGKGTTVNSEIFGRVLFFAKLRICEAS